MGFKDIIKNDIQNTFLDLEEFGEPHLVGSREMTILIDDNEMIEREKRMPVREEKDGIYRRQLLFYVAAAVFGPLPPPGRTIMLDGKLYLITDAVNEAGLYSISLEATRAR